MSSFPQTIYSPVTKTNKSGVTYTPAKTQVAFAEDFNLPNSEIVAIETALLAGRGVRRKFIAGENIEANKVVRMADPSGFPVVYNNSNIGDPVALGKITDTVTKLAEQFSFAQVKTIAQAFVSIRKYDDAVPENVAGFKISIQTDADGEPDGVDLGTFADSVGDTGFNLRGGEFDVPVVCEANALYWLVIEATNELSDDFWLEVQRDNLNDFDEKLCSYFDTAWNVETTSAIICQMKIQETAGSVYKQDDNFFGFFSGITTEAKNEGEQIEIAMTGVIDGFEYLEVGKNYQPSKSDGDIEQADSYQWYTAISPTELLISGIVNY